MTEIIEMWARYRGYKPYWGWYWDDIDGCVRTADEVIQACKREMSNL